MTSSTEADLERLEKRIADCEQKVNEIDARLKARADFFDTLIEMLNRNWEDPETKNAALRVLVTEHVQTQQIVGNRTDQELQTVASMIANLKGDVRVVSAQRTES